MVAAFQSLSAFRQTIVLLIRSVWTVNVERCHAVPSTGIVQLAFPVFLANVATRLNVAPILTARPMPAALRGNASR